MCTNNLNNLAKNAKIKKDKAETSSFIFDFSRKQEILRKMSNVFATI
jgi:hypothetical protein